MSQGNNEELEFFAFLVDGENWKHVKKFAEDEIHRVEQMTMRGTVPVSYEAFRESRGVILGIEQLISRIENVGKRYAKEKRDGRRE